MSYVLSKKTVSTAKGVGVSSEKYPKLHLVDVMSDTWYPIPPPPRVYRYNIAHVRPCSKSGAQKIKSKARSFSVFVCQNWMKNGHVMTMRNAHAKVAHAILGHQMAKNF